MDFIKDVENLVRNERTSLPTVTQIRLLLSNSAVIKNKILSQADRNTDVLSEELQNEIHYLLIKHIYQCGREKIVKKFDETFKISANLKCIGNSRKNYEAYYRYLEEIVAYVKYYENERA